MKEEIKTLKDLAKLKLNRVQNWTEKQWRDWNNTKASKHNIVFDADLKAEAIKRIKSCKGTVDFSRHDRCGKALDIFPYNHCDVCQREIWFNNITSEDLK